MKKLKDKVAIITGASKGIGEGIARVFARYGAKLVLVARGEEVLELARDLTEQGYTAFGVRTDVSDQKSVDAMVQAAVDTYGTIDILVNNAGICVLEDFDAPDYAVRDRHIDINIKGVWNVTHAVLPHMIEKKDGRIVVMSSVTGYMVADPGEAAYAMTKAALIGFTRAMAREVADHNIRVNAIAPGSTGPSISYDPEKDGDRLFYPGTDMPYTMRDLVDNFAIERPAGSDEMAGLILYLASDDASYTTGQVICVDGGWTAGFSGDY